MRIRPQRHHAAPPGFESGEPGGGASIDGASNLGASLRAWLDANARTEYIVDVDFDPRYLGAQLVAAHYVPKGLIGFVKELHCVPLAPAELIDPWRTVGVQSDGTVGYENNGPGAAFGGATGFGGWWSTPAGWTAYYIPGETPPPVWYWELRLVPGDIRNKRAFSATDPASWYGAVGEPVPAIVYGGSAAVVGVQFPGQAVWTKQHVQVSFLQSFRTHVLVPEDHTACLFASWSQGNVYRPSAAVGIWASEGGIPTLQYGEPSLPILPTAGQLIGYDQPAATQATSLNAIHGWGG